MTHNPLQNFAEFIPFGSFTIQELKESIVYHLDIAQNTVSQIENSNDVSWEYLQKTLYLDLYKLNQQWGILNHLESVTDTVYIRQLQETLQPLITNFYVNLGQSSKLCAIYHNIKNSKYTQLNTEEQKVIDNEFINFFLNGVELKNENQLKFKQIQNELSQLSTKFGQNVLDATDNYIKYVSKEQLIGVPNDILEMLHDKSITDKNIYKLSLHMPKYLPIMQYCENRELRKELYTAYATRASEFGDPNLNNSNIIYQLLLLRQEKAKLLNFASYSELSLYTKMADNPNKVLNFLYELADKVNSKARLDLLELTNYAKSNYGITKLEMWDIPFISEHLHQQKYNYSNHELKQYFQVNHVLNGLFNLIYKLYKVKFQINPTIPAWHNNVLTYNILKDKHIIGYLYLDLYARNGKHSGAWMNSVQDRFVTQSINKKPSAFIICNFTPPAKNTQSLLTFDDVQTLFHEMGHALHHLLTQIDHPNISGINGVEWDAVELPSQFMEYFAWDYSVLQNISCHIQTSDKIPHSLYNKLLISRNYHSGLHMLRQLEFALIDMTLHSQNITKISNIFDVVTLIRQKIAVIAHPVFDRPLNSFGHIFDGEYAAGYYSYKWAEILAIDIFSEFEKQGEHNYSILGERFYSKILSQGGLQPMLENFIAFMGREPQINALLKSAGIN